MEQRRDITSYNREPEWWHFLDLPFLYWETLRIRQQVLHRVSSLKDTDRDLNHFSSIFLCSVRDFFPLSFWLSSDVGRRFSTAPTEACFESDLVHIWNDIAICKHGLPPT
ncbi:hypothetical protein NPIL_482731 [Nephila pilipes]|uniref:Uncharacterized protein n=1 Tax=Nephila pilipes TaxID=299642 RepID=A0A8X6IVC5_NEPPI|nr:hypothetical protein NPIL_482731 [Nephila pilipes]